MVTVLSEGCGAGYLPWKKIALAAFDASFRPLDRLLDLAAVVFRPDERS
jgi:hypothetical protein